MNTQFSNGNAPVFQYRTIWTTMENDQEVDQQYESKTRWDAVTEAIRATKRGDGNVEIEHWTKDTGTFEIDQQAMDQMEERLGGKPKVGVKIDIKTTNRLGELAQLATHANRVSRKGPVDQDLIDALVRKAMETFQLLGVSYADVNQARNEAGIVNPKSHQSPAAEYTPVQ